MADDNEDKSSKTEEPSDRKLQKLRDQGNVPKSKEVNNFFALIGMLIAVVGTVPFAMSELFDSFGAIYSDLGSLRADTGPAIGSLMYVMARDAIIGLVPTFILFAVLGVFSGFIQTGPIFSWEQAKPKLSKISLVKGFERLFSMKSLAEFLKSLLKMIVVGAIIYVILMMHRTEIFSLLDKTAFLITTSVQTIIVRILIGALAIAAIFAVIDFMFEKAQFLKQQRMSMKELKDEMKESEGDPHVKGRQRQIRMERARQRMMQEVPNADVVITNPTHYAVALQYKPDEGMNAPRVVAKGVDHLAMKIREIAEENNVPFYEDPPLARKLYAEAEVDEFIPLELYEAVAKVVAYIFSIKAKRRAS